MAQVLMIVCLFFGCTEVFAQRDSSSIFEKRISGGSSKTWYTRLSAVGEVPGVKSQKSFTCNLKLRKAEWLSFSGKNISSRKFTLWSIRKRPDSTYLLMFPKGEKYLISFKRSMGNSWILILENIPPASKKRGVQGVYFEKEEQPNL
jgi:hypothetical protein